MNNGKTLVIIMGIALMVILLMVHGVIKYIGPKRNALRNLISNELHYVVQLAEYVGNGNGEWNGYRYVDTLRPGL